MIDPVADGLNVFLIIFQSLPLAVRGFINLVFFMLVIFVAYKLIRGMK